MVFLHTVIKKYSNNDITVIWKPDLCQHSEICWKGLLPVFNPRRKPWIIMENGTTEEIIAQVNQCPSGALSYVRNEPIAIQIENP